MKKIFLPLFLLVASWASAAPVTVECNWALTNFKQVNPSANRSWVEYGLTNYRGIWDYDKELGVPLVDLVPEGGTAVDLGGGRGFAYQELVTLKKVKAIVVNAQSADEFSEVPLRNGRQKLGEFKYVEGWAEDFLKSLPGSIDAVTDLWGAFSYSVKKAELLEDIYAALVPGGEARILLPRATPATVQADEETIGLAEWLSREFPEIVTSEMPTFTRDQVIIIKKPRTPRPFKLRLRLSSASLDHPFSGWPTLVYGSY